MMNAPAGPSRDMDPMFVAVAVVVVVAAAVVVVAAATTNATSFRLAVAVFAISTKILLHQQT